MNNVVDKEHLTVAKFISLLIAVLGIVMTVISLVNRNFSMVAISLFYGTSMLIAHVLVAMKNDLKFFNISAVALIYILEITFLINGGDEGFGVIWMILVPLLTLYLWKKTSYTIVNSVLLLIMAVGLLSPINKFIYPFKHSFAVRFPLVLLAEVLFGVFLKFWIERTEKSRNEYFNKLTVRTTELEQEKINREKLMVELTKALAATIDAKDKYTSGHSLRVAQYSVEIAKKMGLSEKDQEDIYLIALLHDIGKIAIPDEIINKTTKLTDEEYQVIKNHPKAGSEILSSIESMPEIKDGARWHHERWDGKGYPDGLDSDSIPKKAQIISVADAYDAMTSTRSYRSVLPQDIVKSEIQKGRGSQFNPEIADIMLSLMAEDKGYSMHE